MENQAYLRTVNHLLALLPTEVYEQLAPSLEQVAQEFKQVLQEPNSPMFYVYFPLSSVASIVVLLEDGAVVEVATVGKEGMVGLPVFLGSDTMPTRTIIQMPGEALRMSSTTFKEAVRKFSPLRDIMQRYTQAMFMFVAQSTACNREHTIEQRCARWLLTSHDRVNTDKFPMTQEFLSQMLGVRRASVSEVANQLQQEGLIQYSRGMITVVDRAGLEARSCECYRVINDEFKNSLG